VILLYNEAISILADYAEYYYANSIKNGVYQLDRDKARRLMKALNAIGQNNIKAMYVGINDKNPNNNKLTAPLTGATTENNSENENKKKRPKFIGRLATTIIIEDGLWLG